MAQFTKDASGNTVYTNSSGQNFNLGMVDAASVNTSAYNSAPAAAQPTSIPQSAAQPAAQPVLSDRDRALAGLKAMGYTSPDGGEISGWLMENPSKVSNPTGPTSSATAVVNNNANKAVTTAVTADTKSPLTDIQSYIANELGLGEEYARNLDPGSLGQFALQRLGVQQADKAAAQAKADQDRMYQASLAESNAQYAAAKNDIETHRANSKDQARQQEYAANPFADTSSAKNGYNASVDMMYDRLNTTLTAQAEQAKAALASGNYKAYAEINNSLETTKQQGLSKIQTFMEGLQKSNVQQQQFKATMDERYQDDYRNALTSMQLPDASTVNKMSDQEIVNSPWGMAAGPDAKKNVQAIRQDMAQQAGVQYKTQAANNAALKAQISMYNAQQRAADKQSAALDVQTIASMNGGAFLEAFNNAAAAGKYTKDKNSQTLSTLALYAQTGDTKNAKTALTNYVLSGGSPTDQRMYQTLSGIPTIVNSLKAKIAALPKDQQQGFLNGNMNEIANKVGQTKDPKLNELYLEFGHLYKNYVAPIYGMRAAASTNDSIFNNLFPSGTDSTSLSLAKLNALVNTANDTVNAQVQARVGTDPFNKIYGASGVLGGTAPAPTKGQEKPYNGATYVFDGTQWNLKK